MSRFCLPLAALAFVAPISSAWSQATGQATLNAVAFQPMPSGVPIETRVLDDSDENLMIRSELNAALASRGFVVVSDPSAASLVLTIETGESVGAWQATRTTDRIEMKDDRGRLFPQGELGVTKQLQLPLPRTTVVTPAQYRIGLTIDQRSGGRIWQGWSAADLSQGEPADIARGMVPKLAESIGQTVREQVFDLQ